VAINTIALIQQHKEGDSGFILAYANISWNHLSPKESLNSDGQQFHQYQQN
jgi:hypothetical protein